MEDRFERQAMGNNGFLNELEIFRTEEEIAQQCFFAYLSVQNTAAENSNVLQMINRNPLFWKTANHAMLLSTFVALGRIFDQSSPRNIDALMSATIADIHEFSSAALRARKIANGLSAQDAAEFVTHAHELTKDDVSSLRKQISGWRAIYQERYRDPRNKDFAHNEVFDIAEINKLLAVTDIAEMKELFRFLSALEAAFFHNGRAPDLHAYYDKKTQGEKVHQEGCAVMRSLLSRNAGGAALG